MSETPEDLKPVESLLTGLLPEAGRLNRDRLLYEAGRAAAPRRLGWPVAALVFAGLSAIVTLQLMTRPEPSVSTVEVVRYVSPSTPGSVEPTRNLAVTRNEIAAGSMSYLSLRDRVLRFGADALPPSPVIADQPAPGETIERGIDHKAYPG